MFPVFCVDDAPRERGRPARTMPRHSLGHLRHLDRPGTAPGVSLGLAVEVHTDRLAGCQVALTLSDLHKGIRMRAGRPRSRGDLLPLMGWGDGRVGAGDRYFFMNIDAQDVWTTASWERGRPARTIFPPLRKRLACIPGNPQSIFFYEPHRTIARAGFRCNNLSSCLSCASCASMLIIRLVATRAVEAAPSRFVALRVLLIVTYGTPRLPPSGSTAGSALSPTPPQGGSDS